MINIFTAFQQRGQRALVIVLCVICILGLSACGTKAKNPQTDILTQKATADGRTPITILVKNAFSINYFEEKVEAKFPNIDIIQVGNYTPDLGIEEYERRLEHDDLTDLVMTWPLDVGEEYWADRLLDLSGYSFTSEYNLSMLNDISRDGKLYYLPGPSQIRGIVYNKTLFQENGWTVPEDFDGFLALCQQIENAGIRSIQLGFKNTEVLDTAFFGYNLSNCYSKPNDVQWINGYNNRIGSFGSHFGPALDVFQQMIDAGIWKESDLEVDYPKRENMLFTRQCAMVEDSVLLTRTGYQLTGSTDEFALMPFFNPGSDNAWARIYMVCYVGANKHLAEPQNKAKFDLVLQLLEYISTPEGQEALAADTSGMFSSLISMPPPDVEEIADLVVPLSQGKYAVFPQLKNAQGALQEGLTAMLRGETDKADVIKMVDEVNQNPPKVAPPEVFGTASSDFSLIETGSFITDAMREWSGCDFALFLDNGKDGRQNCRGVSARMYAGDITEDDIRCIMPDFRTGEKGVIWKVSMTGADLLQTLEYTLPYWNDQTGWFYYFSGLRMIYDPKAEPGTRIQDIKLEDGSDIDEAKIYTVAMTESSIPEHVAKNSSVTDSTVVTVLKDAIRSAKTISPPNDNRFIIP